MKSQDRNDRSDASSSRPSRRVKLEALLFTGAALGTTLLTLGGDTIPKLPPSAGE